MAHNKGFSLIEILVAIAIIAIIATAITPTMRTFFKKDERKELFIHLNNLLLITLNDAILTKKVHRVVFDFEKNSIYAQFQTDTKDNSIKVEYEDISTTYPGAKIKFDSEAFDIKNFFIDGKDEMQLRGTEIKKDTLWFFISPDGISQVVVININETQFADNDGDFSFVLNPFTVQFTDYEQFSSP